MGAAIALREDLDSSGLRRLGKATKDVGRRPVRPMPSGSGGNCAVAPGASPMCQPVNRRQTPAH